MKKEKEGRTELKIAQANLEMQRKMLQAKGSYQPTLQGFIVLIPE
jgi:hypothetical protein